MKVVMLKVSEVKATGWGSLSIRHFFLVEKKRGGGVLTCLLLFLSFFFKDVVVQRKGASRECITEDTSQRVDNLWANGSENSERKVLGLTVSMK